MQRLSICAIMILSAGIVFAAADTTVSPTTTYTLRTTVGSQPDYCHLIMPASPPYQNDGYVTIGGPIATQNAAHVSIQFASTDWQASEGAITSMSFEVIVANRIDATTAHADILSMHDMSGTAAATFATSITNYGMYDAPLHGVSRLWILLHSNAIQNTTPEVIVRLWP